METPKEVTTAVSRILWCFLLCAFGWSTIALDPMKLQGPYVSPKYLVPVNPSGRQAEGAIERLLSNRSGNGTMIYTDSTGAAFVVSVWGKDYANHDYDHALHNFITFIEVWVEGEGDLMHAISKKEIDVPIDVDFATAVQRAWAAMLLKTRYPTSQYLGLDGWQSEFSVSVRGAGPIYGQLGSPAEGLPKEMIDLGFALADYCKTPESERAAKRKKLMQWLNDFAVRAAAS
jgi:hypothetical protein